MKDYEPTKEELLWEKLEWEYFQDRLKEEEGKQ